MLSVALFCAVSAGTNRVRISSNFYTRVDHQDHRLWLRASSVRVLAQRLELSRFHDRRCRVSQSLITHHCSCSCLVCLHY